MEDLCLPTSAQHTDCPPPLIFSLFASDYVSVSDPEDQRVQQKNVKMKTVSFQTMRANVQM